MSLVTDIWKSFRSWARSKSESAVLRESRAANQRALVQKQREIIDSLPIVANSSPAMAKSDLAPIIESIKNRDDISNQTKRMLVESLPIQPDWLTPWQDWLNTLQFDGWWPIITGLTGKKEGAFFPFFRSEMELQILRDISRALYTTNNHAQGLELGLRSYTIRKGYKITVTDRDGKDPELQKRTQLFIDRFVAKNELYQREQETFQQVTINGEWLWRIFPGGDDKIPVVRYIWPEQLKQPATGAADVNWSYGVCTDPKDIETVKAYAVHNLDGTPNFDVVDARDIVHFKRGVPRGVKRGVPYFVWGEKDALEQAGKVERNCGHASAIQSAIAYIMQYSYGTKAEIEAATLDNTDYSEGRIYPRSNPQRNVQQFEPGMIVHTSKNEQFVESPYSAGVTGHIEVSKMLMRSAQSKSNAPSWLGSSDASDMGAFTASLVAESPFVMGVESEQDYYAALFMKAIRRAIEYGIAAGLLPSDTLQKIEIKQEVLSPVARDRSVEATIAHTQLEDQTTTPQQVIRESGRKPEEVIKEWKEWKEQGMGKDGGQQQAPPGTPQPGQEQEGGDADGGGLLAQALGGMGQDGSVDEPQKLPTPESLHESFDESKHPRDDHGHFVAHGELDAAKINPKKAEELKAKVTKPEERAKLDAALSSKKNHVFVLSLDGHSNYGLESVHGDLASAKEVLLKSGFGYRVAVHSDGTVFKTKNGKVVKHKEAAHTKLGNIVGALQSGEYRTGSEVVGLDDPGYPPEWTKTRSDKIADFERSGDSFTDFDQRRHKNEIVLALKLGKPVPPEVIADYPDLAENHHSHESVYDPSIPLAPLLEAWSEDDHPRDDKGKFVSGEDMAAAKKDPAKADKLRAKVTDPAQRAKLDAAIGNEPKSHGSRAAALHAKHQEFKQARIDAFNEIKADAEAARGKADEVWAAISDHVDNMPWIAGAESAGDPHSDAMRELEDAKMQEVDTPAELFQQFHEVEAAARQALKANSKTKPGAGDDQLTADDLAENDKRAKAIIAACRAGREHLRTYAQHRREMKAIRDGEPLAESLMPMSNELDYVPLLEDGFTGTIKDKRGAERHYQNGEPVAQPQAEPTEQKGAHSDERMKSLLQRVKEVPAAVMSKVGGYVGKKYQALEAKYGRKGAIAIIVGMVALSPTPIPGSSLIPIALANIAKRMFGKKQESMDQQDGALPPHDELVNAIRQAMSELYAEMGEQAPEISEEDVQAFLDEYSQHVPESRKIVGNKTIYQLPDGETVTKIEITGVEITEDEMKGNVDGPTT